jgi:hypothetical protein
MESVKEYLNLKLTGVNKDLPPHELPPDVWSDCRNVRFHDLSAEQVRGWSQIFGTLNNPPQWLLPVPVDPSYYWMYPGASKIGVTDMTNHYDITPTAGITANLDTNWNGGILNGIAVINNENNNPLWWNGSTSSKMTDLTAWPVGTKCKIIQPYKNYLIALNIDDATGLYDNMVKWSDAADPGTIPTSWDETDATKDAGEKTLSDTSGEILAGKQLGEDFYIYKFESVYKMRYIGGRFIFAFIKVFDTFGTVSQDCVCTVNGKHVVLGDGDIIIHDGNTYQSILDRVMRSWLFNSIDADYFHRSFIVPYYEKDELWFCVPTAGELANIALVWNYKSNKFSIRDIPASRYMTVGILSGTEALDWDTDSQAWDDDLTVWNETVYSPLKDAIIVADKDNTKIYQMDMSDLFDDETYEAYLERTAMPLVDLEHVKLITAVWPRITATDGTELKIRFGSQMSPTDSVLWTDPQTFVVGEGSEKVDVMLKGRYLSARIDVVGQTFWRLHSFDIEIQTAEKY